MAIETDSEQRVVRLFSGYGESPIWAPGGPLSYEESCLSSKLVDDLRVWEGSFYNGPERTSDDFFAVGRELARRLAAELGHMFIVSVDKADGGTEFIRSETPATSPEAVKAFNARFDEEEAEAELLRRGSVEFFAPSSQATFHIRISDQD